MPDSPSWEPKSLSRVSKVTKSGNQGNQDGGGEGIGEGDRGEQILKEMYINL